MDQLSRGSIPRYQVAYRLVGGMICLRRLVQYDTEPLRLACGLAIYHALITMHICNTQTHRLTVTNHDFLLFTETGSSFRLTYVVEAREVTTGFPSVMISRHVVL